MNRQIKALTGLSFGGLVVLFAVNGKALFEALLGFPLLVQAWAAALPMGLWSSLLALCVAMGVCTFVLHWLPPTKDGRKPHFAAETMALVVAVMVTVGQAWQGSAGEILTALWLGVAAGLLAPYLAKGLRSLFAGAFKP